MKLTENPPLPPSVRAADLRQAARVRQAVVARFMRQLATPRRTT
jgi:hypothetical protein